MSIHTVIKDIIYTLFRLPRPDSFTIQTKHHLEDFDAKQYLEKDVRYLEDIDVKPYLEDKDKDMTGLTGWKDIDKLILENRKLIKESEELWKEVEKTNQIKPFNPFK